jgi:hypothetical protein
VLDAAYAGLDATHVYGRLDFKDKAPETDFEIVVNLESWADNEPRPRRTLRLDASIQECKLSHWKIENGAEGRPLASSGKAEEDVKIAFLRSFEFKLPLVWLLANPAPVPTERKRGAGLAATGRLRLRFSLWQNRLPVDALPMEGWIELEVLSEGDLLFGA